MAKIISTGFEISDKMDIDADGNIQLDGDLYVNGNDFWLGTEGEGTEEIHMYKDGSNHFYLSNVADDGDINLTTNNVTSTNSGDISFNTGTVTTSGTSGAINFTTGTSDGTRGNIVLDANEVLVTLGATDGSTGLKVLSSNDEPVHALTDDGIHYILGTSISTPAGIIINAYGNTDYSVIKFYSGDGAGVPLVTEEADILFDGNTSVFAFQTENISETSASNNVRIATGSQSNAGDYDSGSINIYTGTTTTAGDSGAISIYTGAGATNSGSLTLTTGTAGGTRGDIVLDANEIQVDTTLSIVDSNGTNYTKISGGNQSGDIPWTLPTAQGGATTFLKNDGNGALSWSAVTDSPIGGADTQVQFNDAGAFAGDSGLTYNKTTDTLTIGGDVNVSSNNKIYLDGGTNTYLYYNSTSGEVELYVGGNKVASWS